MGFGLWLLSKRNKGTKQRLVRSLTTNIFPSFSLPRVCNRTGALADHKHFLTGYMCLLRDGMGCNRRTPFNGPEQSRESQAYEETVRLPSLRSAGASHQRRSGEASASERSTQRQSERERRRAERQNERQRAGHRAEKRAPASGATKRKRAAQAVLYAWVPCRLRLRSC